jgi:superfamily II DNA or RNA helicase
MTSLPLRAWQADALARFADHPEVDFLAVATPGAGKTTFALAAARAALLARRAERLLVVAPTRHLKFQWAAAAVRFGLELEPDWSERDGALPRDVHGVVVTYQQLAGSPPVFRRLAQGAFAVLDEVHHAGESRAWGEGVRLALEPAARRLALSGTPFRSDGNPIPFVRYVDDEARPDYEYGYGRALADGGVVRPVYFPRINGHMEWTAPDGTYQSSTFDDPLGADLAAQRLRTALAQEGEWLPAVLGQAHRQLAHLRRGDPLAGGLVIAMDQEHARAIARLLKAQHGIHAPVAVSDDPDASGQISRFNGSRDPWLVAVRMVSEGVDIPRLRVGVFATNTSTDLFFRQAVGRLVRWTPRLARQPAYMFIPDDPRLRSWAAFIQRERRHHLGAAADDANLAASETAPASGPDAYVQPSLFAAISAVALDSDGLPMDDGVVYAEPAGAAAAHLTLLEPVPLPVAPDDSGPDGDGVPVPPETLRDRKDRLRLLNAERAKAIARATGLDHAQVNGELNRRAGVRRVSEATADELQRRLLAAEAWLRRL